MFEVIFNSFAAGVVVMSIIWYLFAGRIMIRTMRKQATKISNQAVAIDRYHRQLLEAEIDFE